MLKPAGIPTLKGLERVVFGLDLRCDTGKFTTGERRGVETGLQTCWFHFIYVAPNQKKLMSGYFTVFKL